MVSAIYNGWCRHCGAPARGAGGCLCRRCEKREERGNNLDAPKQVSPFAPLVSGRERICEAALAYADAEGDDAYAAALERLFAAALAVAAECGWKRR